MWAIPLSLVVVLAKMGMPGSSATYYSAGGNTTNIDAAMRFDSISEAYKMQLQLGVDSQIVSE